MVRTIEIPFSYLKGKTLTKVVVPEDKNQIDFWTSDNEKIEMFHSQECCENVFLEDVVGEWDEIIGYPIELAEDVYNDGDGVGACETWAFYKLVTNRGFVTLRWYGESNGYYSTTANLYRIVEDS